MGCIEICLLKCSYQTDHKINRNMGCIEMINCESGMLPCSEINRNMGCIEIQKTMPEQSAF